MLATDNHIGYMEKDPVRFNDSLESFEEILKYAESERVRYLCQCNQIEVNTSYVASPLFLAMVISFRMRLFYIFASYFTFLQAILKLIIHFSCCFAQIAS